MTSVDIILPYYNGSNFVKEQLESILSSNLENIDLTIILINDASTLGESEYIKSIFPSNHIYVENQFNLGVIKTIEKGLQISKAPYVMLCDHDDVWLPDKIKISVEKLQETEEDSSAMVFSDLVISGPMLERIHSSMITFSGFRYEKAYPSIIYQNIVTGCTIIMNRKLIEFSLPFPDRIPMHDHWLAVCAVFAGKLNLLNTPTILYRQHEHNLVGANMESYFGKLTNFKRIVEKFQNHLILKHEMAKALSSRLKHHNLDTQSIFVNEIAEAIQKQDTLFLIKKRILRGGFIRVLGNIVLLTFFRSKKKAETVSLVKLAQSGFGIVLSSLFGIGLIKIISIKSGPQSLGYFGVFRQFFQLMTVVFTLGNGFAIIEGIPKSNDKNHFIKNVSGYTFWVCVILSLLVLAFSVPISEGIFGNNDHLNLIRLMPIMIFSIAYTLLMRSIYSAEGKLIPAGLFWSFSYLFMFIVGLFSTELTHLYFYGSIMSFIAALSLFKEKALLIPTFKVERLRNFERTAISTAIAGITGFFSFLTVRAICVNELGADDGGYLETSWSLVNYIVLIFLTSLSAYYLPQISERPKDVEFRKKFFIIINFLSLSSLLFLCLGKEIIIPLLFSKKFLPASGLLIIMSVGEYFKCLNYFFNFSLIGTTNKRAYLILDTSANFLFVIMAFAFHDHRLETFGYIYVAYQAFYLLGSICLNSLYKIIPVPYLAANLAVGLTVWLGYFYL